MSVDQPLIEALSPEVEKLTNPQKIFQMRGMEIFRTASPFSQLHAHTTHKVIVNKALATITFGCLDEGVDEDYDGLVGDPESFLTFFSFSGGESGPF